MSSAILIASCGAPVESPPGRSAAPAASAPLLTDATAASALEFRHDNGAAGRFSIAEIMGAGVGLLDCDADGDLDLVLRQGGPLPGAPSAASAATDRLLRNDPGDDDAGHAMPRFVDVTAGSGLDRAGFGMGVATGDYDGDGRTDIYLTNLGANRLLRSLGDCRFEDVTVAAGVGGDDWSIAAAFFDYDLDGAVDLYVGNYLDLASEVDRQCVGADGAPDYCGPLAYRPLGDRLFRNLGEGRFEDVSVAAGLLGRAPDRTLGAVVFDADRDGRLDLFVAHDAGENDLWIGAGAALEEQGALRGVAVNSAGLRTGDMGVEVADFDGDLAPDLVSTHLAAEGMGYWTGDDSGGFRDQAASAGVLRATLGGTGFGIAVLDLENDGWPDLYVANGNIHRNPPDRARPGGETRFDEPDRLLSNQRGRLVDVSSATPAVAGRSEVGRGVATGDLDNDGDLDLVLTNNGGPARVLLSRASELGPWTGVRLLDARGLEAVGSEATLFCADGRGLWRRSATDGSYASARDPRVHFGLGECRAPERLEVRWPDGSRESFDAPSPGAYHDVRQGTGRPAAAAGVS